MLPTHNVVVPLQTSVAPVTIVNIQHATQNDVKAYAKATFSLMVIGVGSIIFGCADLVAGFMGFSFLWSWSLLFTYAWAGFLFAIINGSLALKAATLKPHVDQHWANVTFGFGIATLVFHLIDGLVVVISVYLLSFIKNYEMYRTGPDYVNTGSNVHYYYYSYYYYQSPLVAEAPRLVIVSVLLALDIWLIVATSILREHFRKQPLSTTSAIVMSNFTTNVAPGTSSVSASLSSPVAQAVDSSVQDKSYPGALQVQTPDIASNDAAHFENSKLAKQVQVLVSGKEAFVLCGLFSIVYGVGQLAAGLLAYAEWSSVTSSLRWLHGGFSIVAFAFAIINGALALRGANNKPNIGSGWSTLVFVAGIVSLIAYLVATGFAIHSLVRTGQAGASFYKSVAQGQALGQYDIRYNIYVRAITPAVPEAARLVTLFVLVSCGIIQVVYASKLRAVFGDNASISLSDTQTSNTMVGVSTAPVAVSVYTQQSTPVPVPVPVPAPAPVPVTSGDDEQAQPQANTGTVASESYASGNNVASVYPAAQLLVVEDG